MDDSYEALVIGAGMGGLAAAAHLRLAGRRVLLLESNPHPGGTAFVYHRQGYAFPMGPLGFASPGKVAKLLESIGAGGEAVAGRIGYRLRAFGWDISLSQPLDELGRRLAELVPGDAPGIAAFFREVERLPPGPCEGSDAAAEYLARTVADPRLTRVLGSQGTGEPYSTMPLLAAMWRHLAVSGIWYPRGGFAAFAARLADAAGAVRLGSGVAAINVARGRVVGATLGDGTRIAARAIISNADFKRTFLELLAPDDLPGAWREAVSRARLTGSVFQVALGLDAGRVDLSAFAEATRLIVRRTGAEELPGPAWAAGEIDPDALARQELELALWSGDDAALAPPGCAVAVVRTAADFRHFAPWRTGPRKRQPGYAAYKMRLSRALVGEVEGLLPGLAGGVRVMDIATPLTFLDQGGRSEGAVAGWSWDYEDTADTAEAQAGKLIRTPIAGLYMAGHQAAAALFSGGVSTALESGILAAEALLQEAGPAMSPSLPGAGRPRSRTG